MKIAIGNKPDRWFPKQLNSRSKVFHHMHVGYRTCVNVILCRLHRLLSIETNSTTPKNVHELAKRISAIYYCTCICNDNE